MSGREGACSAAARRPSMTNCPALQRSLPCCPATPALQKDAARRGRLGASTFKSLNAGELLHVCTCSCCTSPTVHVIECPVPTRVSQRPGLCAALPTLGSLHRELAWHWTTEYPSTFALCRPDDSGSGARCVAGHLVAGGHPGTLQACSSQDRGAQQPGGVCSVQLRLCEEVTLSNSSR